MTTNIVLSENEHARTVELSAHYSDGWYENTSLCHAIFFAQGSTMLRRLSSDEELSAQKFQLSSEELDVLTATWTAYKADQAAKKLAEAMRRASVEQQARALADAHGITIEDDGDEDWCIIHGEERWSVYGPDPDALLRKVERLVKLIQEQQAQEQEQARLIAEATVLAEAHDLRIRPGVNDEGQARWDIICGQTEVATIWKSNGQPGERLLRDVRLLIERMKK